MKFLRTILIISLLFTFSPVHLQALESDKIILPDMGDSAGTLISPVEEKELGDAFFRYIQGKVEVNQDPDIHQYIQSIGQRLVINSDAPQNPFYFFVVIDSSINAFAGPGGYIGINSGLILTTESESELASVMAHEVAHVTQRHLYRAFEAAKQLSLPTAAGVLAAILLGTQSPELGLAALTAVQAGSAQFQIDFTRDNEQEADRIGMQTLVNSNFNPRSMPVFFERLQQSSRYYGQGVPEFLRTHPVNASRISDTRGRSEKFPYRQYPDSQNYLLTKAKLRVNSIDISNDAAKNYFNARKSQGTPMQRAVARYGLGLLSLKTQQFDDANQIFTQLVRDFPNQPQLVTALARSAFDARNYAKALKIFKQTHEQFPFNLAVKFEYISTLLKVGQTSQAYQILNTLSNKEKQQTTYKRLMAHTYGALKQQAKSHRYMAEYYYSIGQSQAAITQIKLAQQSKDLNFYLAAILDQRLHFFIEEERQRLLEE